MRSLFLSPAATRARTRFSFRRTTPLSLLLLAVFATGGVSRLYAPPTPVPPKVNFMGDNGGFEKTTPADNLWDGVNGDGSLANFTFSARVVTEKAAFAGLAMPPSVAFVDLNGDGKPDLITADPTGFFHFYPNSGTAAAPKFTNAEVIPLFVSTCFEPKKWDYDWNNDTDDIRFCPRFALADWRHSGVLDMLIGNYFGEILFVRNAGNTQQPAFRLPGTIDKARVPTNDQGRYWANLLAPAAYNRGNNGVLDLLAGEGTYSANSIHLLENVGDSEMPKFSSAKHTSIAHGDGREQLIPTVVDFNGDGFPDVIVADRTGEVGVYLSPGPKPKPTEEFKRAATITFGGSDKLPGSGLAAPYAADFNGDGLFDLIFGLPNGHIAVSLNTGTKTEPKFGPVQDIKGVDKLGAANMFTANGWTNNTWSVYGNALAYFNVVNNQTDPASKPPEGANCMKAAYWPLPGQTFQMPIEGIPGAPRHFTLIRRDVTLEQGKHYKFSFKVKGNGMDSMRWDFQTRYYGHPGPTKFQHGERGEATNAQVGLVGEVVDNMRDFNAGSAWTTVDGDFTARYKNPALSGEKTMPAILYVDFYAANLNAVAYFDDFHLEQD